MILAAVPDAAEKGLIDAPADVVERMQEQARSFGAAELSRAADIVNEGLTEMRGAHSPRLQLELICARVMLPAAYGDERSVMARLDRIERGVQFSGGAGAPAMGYVPGPEAHAGAGAAAPVAAPVPGGGPAAARAAVRGQGAGTPPGGDPSADVAAGAGDGAGAGTGPASDAGGAPPVADTRRPRPLPPTSLLCLPHLRLRLPHRLPLPLPLRRPRPVPGRVRPPRAAGAAPVDGPRRHRRAVDSPGPRLPPPPAPPRLRPRRRPRGGSPRARLAAVGRFRGRPRSLWPNILEAVKNRRRFTWILLSQNAQVTGFDGTSSNSASSTPAPATTS